MCIVCYSPGVVVGEIAMIGGPLAAAVVMRVRRSLGYVPTDEAPAPDRSQERPTAASADAPAAASSAAG